MPYMDATEFTSDSFSSWKGELPVNTVGLLDVETHILLNEAMARVYLRSPLGE